MIEIVDQSWVAELHAEIIRNLDIKYDLLREHNSRFAGAIVKIGGLVIPEAGIKPALLRLDYPFKRRTPIQWLKSSDRTVDTSRAPVVPITEFVGTFQGFNISGTQPEDTSLGIGMSNVLLDDKSRIIGSTFVYSTGLIGANSQPLADITIAKR